MFVCPRIVLGLKGRKWAYIEVYLFLLDEDSKKVLILFIFLGYFWDIVEYLPSFCRISAEFLPSICRIH